MNLVTHYFRRPAEKNMWVPLNFISMPSYSVHVFYIGTDSTHIISSEEIAYRESLNEIKELESKRAISDDQELWLTPNYDIWLASGKDPINDPNKLLLEEGTFRLNDGFESIKSAICKRRGTDDRAPGKFKVIKGNYVPGNAYKTLTDQVVELLRSKNNAVVVYADKIKWELLINSIAHHQYDFSCDPYFLLSPRNMFFDVVKFGSVKQFTCCVRQESRIFELLDQYRHLDFKSRIIEISNLVGTKLEIGILGETAASIETSRLLNTNANVSECIIPFVSPQEGRELLIKNGDYSIFVCDIGVAKSLCAIQDINNRVQIISNLPSLKFAYSEEIPVGFVYPRADQRWKADLVEALSTVILSDGFESHYAEITEELESVGIYALNFDELCEELRVESPQQLEAIS